MRSQRGQHQVLLAAGAAGTAALCLVPLLVAADPRASPAPTPAWMQLLAIALPAAAGVYALWSGASRRYGALLLLTGWGWTLTALSRSPDDLLYSIGRVSAWFLVAALMLTMLAFPSGRIVERSARRLTVAIVLTVLVLYVPTAFLVTRYPVPSPFESCKVGCPHNAFQLTRRQPALVDPEVVRVRNAVTFLLACGIPVILAVRMRRSTRVARRVLSPVTVASSVFPLALAAGLAARAAAPGSTVVDVASQLLVLSVSFIAAAFLVGLTRRRLFEAAALGRLATALGRVPSPVTLREALSEALGDPSLELWYADDARGLWLNADGRAADELPAPAGRSVTRITRNGRSSAALVHDPGLLDDGELVHAAGGIAGAALENQQLSLALEASLHEVEESRLRIAAAADEARRRIEQDLHDGAQQSLVALRVRLELAAERLQEDPTIGADELRGLGEEVDQINDEVRALASGIYPSLLTGSGLKDALRAVAMRAPITVDVAVDGIGRYAPAIESAVYFTCLEALQNATKHANATRVDVDLADRGGRLRFSVHDDGRGFDRQARSPGAGLTSMRDRIAAIGGTLVVRSSPGEGTTIRGEVAGEPVG